MSRPRLLIAMALAAIAAIAVALVLLVAPRPAAPRRAASPSMPTAPAFTVHSSVPGIFATATSRLPRPQHKIASTPDGFCTGIVIAPKTKAGRAAAKAGWWVTSEVQAAGYSAVGAFSRGQSGTSGACFVEDGNVLIFRASRLVAIVYGNPPETAPAGLIGGVSNTSDPGRLRISDWSPVDLENADLLMSADAISVVALPAQETVCGRLTVPNIRGMQIPEVRKVLARFGWEPPPAAAPPAATRAGDDAQEESGDDETTGEEDDTEEETYDSASRFHSQGLTEFEDCSGTGFGFCNVRYIHNEGANLLVTTYGDDSIVSGYTEECADPERR